MFLIQNNNQVGHRNENQYELISFYHSNLNNAQFLLYPLTLGLSEVVEANCSEVVYPLLCAKASGRV